MSQRGMTSRLAVASLGLALAACSNQAAAPAPLPSDGSAKTPSVPATSKSPTIDADPATLPSMPSAAMGTSDDAAKEFVRYWISVLNYSGPAGTTSKLRQFSSSKCFDCDAIADLIDRVAKAGGRIEGKGWTVRKATITGSTASGLRIITSVTVHPQVLVVKRAAKPKRFPGAPVVVKVFFLKPVGNHWTVRRLDQRKV